MCCAQYFMKIFIILGISNDEFIGAYRNQEDAYNKIKKSGKESEWRVTQFYVS